MGAGSFYGRAPWRGTVTGVLSAVLAAGATATLVASVASAAPAPRASSTPAQLAYTALTPARIADTRCGDSPAPSFCSGESLPSANSALKTLPAGSSVVVAMPSSVPSGAGAVVLNVAAVDQTNSGFLTVWPAGAPMPSTANVNFAPSQSAFGVNNLVTVPLGSSSGGAPAVSVYDGPANGGPVDVVVDLQGYYAPATGNAGGFTGESPTRIADSRCTGSSPAALCSGESLPSANNSVVTLGPGATDTLTVAGVGGVPSTGVAAAIMDIAITDATAPSFLSVYPGPTQPTVANVNWTTGETLANKVLVELSPTGTVTLYNNAGTVDVVVDVDGWFSSALSTSAGSLFTPLSPARLADTRCGAIPVPSSCAGEGLPSANSSLTSLLGGQSAPVSIAGQDSVPSSASAAVLNITDVQPQGGNYLTVYPVGTTAPLASDDNFVPGDPYNVVPNAAYATLGSTGGAAVLNGPANAGLTNVVVDLFGYFSLPASSTATLTSTLASLTANGVSTSTLTTTLMNGGVPVSGVPVSLTGTPSVSGACGTLSPSSGTTNSSGQFTSTYTSSLVAGTCTVASSVDGLVPTTVLTQIAGSGVQGSLASTVSSLTANGLSTSTLTTTLTNGGVPVSGVPVSLSEIPSLAGACGTLSPASGVTNSAGQFVSTYTSSPLAGTCTVASSVDGLAPSLPLTQIAGAGSAATLVPSVSSLAANGASTSTLTSTLGLAGVPLPGIPVVLSETPSVPGACGTLSPALGVTNSAGQFVSSYTSSLVAGTCTITSTLDLLSPSTVLTQIP